MSTTRIYDLMKMLFMTTTIRVKKETTLPNGRAHIETLYEGGTLETEIPLNIQYLTIKGIEATGEDTMNIYVY